MASQPKIHIDSSCEQPPSPASSESWGPPPAPSSLESRLWNRDSNSVTSRDQPMPYRLYRRMMLGIEHAKTTPAAQFGNHVDLELTRLRQQRAWYRSGRVKLLKYNAEDDARTNAERNVKQDWIEQGIWRESWTTDSLPGGWKHEDTFDQSEAGQLARNHSYKNDPSRPEPQFRYQVIQERRWLAAQLPHWPSNELEDDIYFNVRSRWQDWGIWSSGWNWCPESSDCWRHETLLDVGDVAWSKSNEGKPNVSWKRMIKDYFDDQNAKEVANEEVRSANRSTAKRSRLEIEEPSSTGTQNEQTVGVSQCLDAAQGTHTNSLRKKRVKFSDPRSDIEMYGAAFADSTIDGKSVRPLNFPKFRSNRRESSSDPADAVHISAGPQRQDSDEFSEVTEIDLV